MVLTPAQDKIAADTHRFRVLNCGRRFGKTTLAIEEIKGKALFKESRICYIAPTIQQARDIAWATMLKELKPIIVKAVESPSREITVKNMKGTTSLIQLSSWEKIETLRGQQFDFIVLDEVASMRNFWLNWDEVIRPTLTDTKGECLFISTPKGFDHFFDLYKKELEDSDYKSFHFTTYDNPFIPTEEIDKAKLEIPEDRFAQEYCADFRKFTGLVYKEFDRARHIYTNGTYVAVNRTAPIDWGWTNPATSYLIEKDTDRNYWISNEFYKTQKTTVEIIEYVKSLRPDAVYPDSAEPDRNMEAKRAGLNVREVSKDIEAGINCVRELLKQGRLHIHSSCVNLINEFETYSYPEKKPDKNENELPIKENDHGLDAIRYDLYMQEGKTDNKSASVNYPGLIPTNTSRYDIPVAPTSGLIRKQAKVRYPGSR